MTLFSVDPSNLLKEIHSLEFVHEMKDVIFMPREGKVGASFPVVGDGLMIGPAEPKGPSTVAVASSLFPRSSLANKPVHYCEVGQSGIL